jgi:chorismate dehydratase
LKDVNYSRKARTLGSEREPVLNRPATSIRQTVRIGSVSYLNAKPLVFGLVGTNDVDLHLAVPSQLLDGIRTRQYDVALLPVIDYQRLPGLRIIPAGGIGSDGPTLTVRLFSNRPIERMQSLVVDPDSHTSVALARIVLAENYGIFPRFDPSSDEAMLLIGDKVVCEEPVGFPYQLDLGAAWKKLTGLPFVFAVWMVREVAELGDLPARLEQSKRDGLNHIDEIISRFAVPRGWPRELAHQYLTENLQYDIGPRQIEAIETFHHLAAKHGMIGEQLRPLSILSPGPVEDRQVVERGTATLQSSVPTSPDQVDHADL